MLNEFDVCVIGAGVAGALVAESLSRLGAEVVLVEAGSRYPLNGRSQQLLRHQVLGEDLPPWRLPKRDGFVDASDDSLGYQYELNWNRVKGVGGSTLHWGGLAQRLRETDFSEFSTYGTGIDWPISYDDLEPYYCDAEAELGVAGDAEHDESRRSRPYPMPPFPLGFAQQAWLPVLDRIGVSHARTSWARNSVPYRGRSECVAYSVCNYCPVGARYSADFHVGLAEKTGRCQVLTETVARRIEVDASGRVRRVHVENVLDRSQRELSARHYVVACHGIESARLLLLSDGLGNHSDQVGRNLMEHWYVFGGGYQERQLFPERIGFGCLESNHFYDGPERQSRGAIKLEFPDNKHDPTLGAMNKGVYGSAVAEYDCSKFGHWAWVGSETQHQPDPESRVTLDPTTKDMFGDPVPGLRFRIGEFDRRTQEQAREYIAMLLTEFGVKDVRLASRVKQGAHHMGTCRMSRDPALGVVNADCQVHGIPNLFVAGSSVFPTSGARQPTLTIAALALRLAKHLADLRS